MTIKTVIFATLIAATPFIATSVQAHEKVGYRNGGYENVTHRGHGKRHPFARTVQKKRCVAVAKRARGFGQPVPGTRRVGNAFRMPAACRIALNQCNRTLDRRQHRGLNRWASCRIVNRIH